jgi:hypothetical protein
MDSRQITSVYDLALIIIDECSKVFFDRAKPDLRPEVIEVFGSAISNIVSKFEFPKRGDQSLTLPSHSPRRKQRRTSASGETSRG